MTTPTTTGLTNDKTTKVSAKVFDAAINGAQYAKTSLQSCKGAGEIENETRWVFRALTKLVNMELLRKNADRLERREKMIEYCNQQIMTRNNWTFEQMANAARDYRADLRAAGYYK